MSNIDNLKTNLIPLAKEYYNNLICEFDEIILECNTEQYRKLLFKLRDDDIFAFTQLIDLCAIDYLQYKNKQWEKDRFVVVYNLLSITNNLRIRIKVAIADEKTPIIQSVVDIFNNANWYEREAFDLYGILFTSHPDLRRILTDYNFVGYPFRKDFPISGYMEMAYDKEQERVIYKDVSIEPRMNVPRIIREEGYGN